MSDDSQLPEVLAPPPSQTITLELTWGQRRDQARAEQTSVGRDAIGRPARRSTCGSFAAQCSRTLHRRSGGITAKRDRQSEISWTQCHNVKLLKEESRPPNVSWQSLAREPTVSHEASPKSRACHVRQAEQNWRTAAVRSRDREEEAADADRRAGRTETGRDNPAGARLVVGEPPTLPLLGDLAVAGAESRPERQHASSPPACQLARGKGGAQSQTPAWGRTTNPKPRPICNAEPRSLDKQRRSMLHPDT